MCFLCLHDKSFVRASASFFSRMLRPKISSKNMCQSQSGVMYVFCLVATHLDKRDNFIFLTDGSNFVDIVRMSDIPDLEAISVSEQ